jgi:4-amino-4-deoxy-L-arabinose transferase-like glycosyltransferase
MSETSIPQLVGLGGAALGLAAGAIALAVRLAARLRTAPLSRWWCGLAGLAAVAVACVRVRGIPVGGYLRGILGDLSVTTMLLLGASVLGVFGRSLLDKKARAALYGWAVPAGLILYPLTLGLTRWDPYALGFQPRGLVLMVAVIVIGLWCWRRRGAALVLTAGVAAFDLGVLESRNLWDYLLDPWLFAWAAGSLVAGSRVGRWVGAQTRAAVARARLDARDVVMTPSRPFPDLIAGALLTLVALSLFAIRLSLPSVLDDRGFYLHGAWVLDAVQNGHWVVQRNHVGDVVSKPPLYIWLAALTTLPFGRISLLSMLLPSAVATVAIVAMIWRFGGESFGKRAGLLGALAYLLSYVGASQIALARPDGVFAFTVTAAALAAFRAWTSGQGWTWFWLAAAVATLAKGPLGLFLAAAGLLAAGWERWSGRAAPIAGSHRSGIVLFLLITGGWFGWAYLELGQALIDRMIFRELLRHAIADGDGSGPGHPFFIQPVNFLWSLAPWSLFACVGFWRVWARPACNQDERRAERFLFCWFVVGLLLFSLAPHQQERHLLPIMPAAALVAGRELARRVSTMSPRALLVTCAAVAIAGLSVLALSYHLVLDGSERVARAQGMRMLAHSIRARVGVRFPLTHVDTPFALQFFLGSTAPLASVEQAASLLSGPDAAFIAVRDVDSLRAALAQTRIPLFVVARWPTTGKPDVSIISNHARLEWTAEMSVVFGPIVIRTRGVRFVRRREQEFVLNLTGQNGAVAFENESREPQVVRARIMGSASESVQERLLAPGDQWLVTVSREGERSSAGASQRPVEARPGLPRLTPTVARLSSVADNPRGEDRPCRP